MGNSMAAIIIVLQFIMLLFSYSLAHYSNMKTKLSFGYAPPSEEEYYTAEDGESSEEIIMPKEEIKVVLNDSELFTLLTELDLPRQFNDALSVASGGASRGEESHKALYSKIAFKTYNLLVEGKSPIDSLNEAIAKVKEHLNTTFKMKLILKNRFNQANWPYDMFLFRAILEIFGKAFAAGLRRKHILLPQTSLVCSLCVKPYNMPLARGGYCPIRKCGQKVDLSAHKLMNDENIKMIDVWFDDFKFFSPQDARKWQKQFLPNYLPGRFLVEIVNTELAEESEEEADPSHSYQFKHSFNYGPQKFDANHQFGYSNGTNQEHSFAYSSPRRSPAPHNFNTKMSFNSPDGKRNRMSTKFSFSNNHDNSFETMPPKAAPKAMQHKMNVKFGPTQKYGGISPKSQFSSAHSFNGHGFKYNYGMNHFPQ
ncbi:unnamed protein product [Meloidogyne enterolobii]|uniref:Uncharacterized protein n=1 Tax=Meloidogyne enterolobii TaxID=390850 RepID=A0ACB1ABU4_MELEN